MSESANDKLKRLTQTANRLRMIQADFADESEQVRKEHLSEEVERALGEINPADREQFLQDLTVLFPTWDRDSAKAPPQPPAGAAVDESKLLDPQFLAERLIDLAGQLGQAEKQLLIEKLRHGGLAPRGRAGWSEQAIKQLQEKLGHDADVDPDRTMEMIASLVAFAASLDQLVWNTWRQMAPRSDIRRTGELRKNMARFIEAGPELPAYEVMADLDQLRKLIAAIVSAVSQVGSQFAKQYLGRFSPNEISAMVKMETGGIFTSRDVKCWNKYIELTREWNEASLENEINQSIASYAESLMKGIERRGRQGS